MDELKVPFGLRDGKLHYITEVETGLACGCVCPDPRCAKPLVARNRRAPDRRRAMYFAHASNPRGCGGREGALHQMGKNIVAGASHLALPSWSALNGELAFDSANATLAAGSAQEVLLADGQLRPDVRVSALCGPAVLPALYVEIKVSHAVDWAKRKKVIAAGLDVMEIDLSRLSDDVLQDPRTFEHHVLEQPQNRQWIHVADPAFMAVMSGHQIFQVTAKRCREKRVPTQRGNVLLLREQEMLLYEPAGPCPSNFFGELADTIRDGQPVDHFGNPLPYQPGLYVRGSVPKRGYYDNKHFKTQLRAITQDLPSESQRLLF